MISTLLCVLVAWKSCLLVMLNRDMPPGALLSSNSSSSGQCRCTTAVCALHPAWSVLSVCRKISRTCSIHFVTFTKDCS